MAWFAHELAGNFGCPDPQLMLRRMSSAQFHKWYQFWCQMKGIKPVASEGEELANKFAALAQFHKSIDAANGKGLDGG